MTDYIIRKRPNDVRISAWKVGATWNPEFDLGLAESANDNKASSKLLRLVTGKLLTDITPNSKFFSKQGLLWLWQLILWFV